MRTLFITFLLIFASAELFAQKMQLAGYTPDNYEVECASIANQGAKMLKIWGYGRKPDLAIIQAKRNAVHSMIFKGAFAGVCTINPLVKSAELAEQNKEYFDEFFDEGGTYLQYVAVSGGAAQDIVRVKDRGRKVYKASIVVLVQYDVLRTRLEKDIKLPSLTTGF
ncbi:MAG: hypothetical protein R3D00_31495 [Bacteroidia bacterium]